TGRPDGKYRVRVALFLTPGNHVHLSTWGEFGKGWDASKQKDRKGQGGVEDADLTQATGWLPHTTRAALTGLRKRGYTVIRERIGAGDSVYRVSGAPAHSEDRT